MPPRDPYADAPISNPYDSSSSRRGSGVARQQRLIESAYKEEERKVEDQKRVKREQQLAADRAERESITARNRELKEQAKEEGAEDFIYADEKGVMKSALSDEQRAELQEERNQEIAQKAESEAGGYQAEMLGRDLTRLKAKGTMLTAPQRDKKLAEVKEKEDKIAGIQRNIEADPSLESAYAGQADIFAQEVSTLRQELDDDDANQAKAEELQEQIWAAEDLKYNRPEGLPRETSTDPEERKEFINSYAMRMTRLKAERSSINENAKQETEAYKQKVADIDARFAEWKAEGVSPEDEREGAITRNRAISEATGKYLRARYDYVTGIKETEDEAREIGLLRPFIDDAVAAQKTWRMETLKEAEEARAKGIEEMTSQNSGQINDFKTLGVPEAAEATEEINRILSSPAPTTKEDAKARSAEIVKLEKKGRIAFTTEMERRADLSNTLTKRLIAKAGNETILKNLADKGWEAKESGEYADWKIPLYNDSYLGQDAVPKGFKTGEVYTDTTQSALRWLTISALNIGETVAKTVHKLAPGTAMTPNKTIKEFQMENGLSTKQVEDVLKDITADYKEWDDDEKTRVKSDGSISFNPSINTLDTEEYEKIVSGSGATQMMKDHMLNEDVRDSYQHAWASTLHETLSNVANTSLGTISPDEWWNKNYKHSSDRPEFVEWMREYADEEGPDNYGFGNNVQAVALRPWRSFSIGGGKMLQMFAGAGAVMSIPGARDASTKIAGQMEAQATARDFIGGKIPLVSSVLDVLLEEGPSLAATMPVGGIAGGGAKLATTGAGKGMFGKAIQQGAFRGGADFARKFELRSAVLGQSIGSGVQSMGLNWQGYYDKALAAAEEEKGGALSEEEKDELAASSDVRGKAIGAGALTMGIAGALGVPAESAVFKHLFGKGSKVHTVRDFWRAAAGGKMTSEQLWERARKSIGDILKSGGAEFAEEFAEEFMVSLSFDSDTTMDEALAAGWEGGKAGFILGAAIKGAVSSSTSGVTTANASDPAQALDALKEVYGRDVDYTQEDVQEALQLVGYQPGKGDADGEVAVKNLRVAIESNRQLSTQEADAVSEIERATDAGDKRRVDVAQRALDKTRQAKAIIKLASGISPQDLTASEQKVVNENLSDGVPVYEDVDGEIIITDSAINMLAKQLPDAAEQLVGRTESARREEVKKISEKKAVAEYKAKQKAAAAPAEGPALTTTEEKAKKAEKPKSKVAKAAEANAKKAAKKTATKKTAARKSAKETGVSPATIKLDNGNGFPSIKSAKRAVTKMGNNVDDYDYIDSPEDGGVVAVYKKTSAKKAAKKAKKPQSKVAKAAAANKAKKAKKKSSKKKKKAEKKPEEAPSGGKNRWRVKLITSIGKVRSVEVEAGSKSEAVAKAAALANKGETVSPTLTENIGPAPEASQQGPKKPKEQAAPPKKLAKPAISRLQKAVGEAFATVSEDTDKEPIKNDWELDDRGELIVKRGLSEERLTKAVVEALAAQVSRKSLTPEEGKALFVSLPTALKDLVKKRGKLKTGKDLSDGEAARYLIENLLTDKVLAATVRKQARSGNRKIIGPFLKLLRGFIDGIRAAMGGASKTARRQLEFYERYALAIMKETTDATALEELGISLPDTRLATTADVTLPVNIKKKRGGYVVRMPDGSRKSVATISEAKTLNASKYQKEFERQATAALSVATRRGGLTIDELDSNIKLMVRMVEAIAGKVGLSKEAIYSLIRVKFSDAEMSSILKGWSEAREAYTKEPTAENKQRLIEADGFFKKKMSQLLGSSDKINGKLSDVSLSEDARRALAANGLATDISIDVAAGNLSAIDTAREMMNKFLSFAKITRDGKTAAKLKDLGDKKLQLLDRLASLAIDGHLFSKDNEVYRSGVETKDSLAVKKEIADIDAQIEQAYETGGKSKGAIRGFEADAGGGRRVMSFTRDADASTVLHEFVHVFQNLKDPRTGKSILESALGDVGMDKMSKWIKTVYPDAEEGDYDWNEALAEGMESFLRAGGKNDSRLGNEFSTVAAGISIAYQNVQDTPGFALNNDARGLLDSLFSIDPVVSNSMQAATTRVQSMFTGLSANVSFMGDDMILPTTNNKKQVGFPNVKSAQSLVDDLSGIYNNVRVARHGLKFYAVIDNPGLRFNTKATSVDVIANLQGGKSKAMEPDIPMSAVNVLYGDSEVLPAAEPRADGKKDKEGNALMDKRSNEEVANMLERAAIDHWGEKITSDNITPEQREKIIRMGIDEFIASFEASGKSAANWYSKSVNAAMAVAAVIHPEISNLEAAKKAKGFKDAEDPTQAADLVMRMAMAITSQNLAVSQNTKAAEEQFEIFKRTGKFNPKKEYGGKAPAISSNLALANKVIEEYGFKGAQEFILEPITVKDLNEVAKKVFGRKANSINGLLTDNVNGAALLGPKIGQGFLQNLMGRFFPVTIDLWMRRTWGRWTGDVVGDGATPERVAKLIDAAKEWGVPIDDALSKSGVETITQERITGAKYKTLDEKFSAIFDRDNSTDPELLESTVKWAKSLRLKGHELYRLSKMPVSQKVKSEIEQIFNNNSKASKAKLKSATKKFIASQTKLRDRIDKAHLDYTQSIKAENDAKRDRVKKRKVAIRAEARKKVAELKKEGKTAAAQKLAKTTTEKVNKIKPVLTKKITKAKFAEAFFEKNNLKSFLGKDQVNLLKPDWARAAEVIHGELGPIDRPANQDRRVISDVINEIRAGLMKRGYKTTNADVQAVLWYPEKDLWGRLKGEDASSLKSSYDEEFLSIAKSRGLEKESLAAIKKSDDEYEREQAREEQRAARTAGGSDRRADGRVSNPLRGGEEEAEGGTIPQGGPQLQGSRDGSNVGPSLTRWHRKTKGSTLAEKEEGVKNVSAFINAINRAKRKHKMGAAVDSVDENKLRNADLFMLEDNMGGLAVSEDGDLFAVFKNPDSKENMGELMEALFDGHDNLKTLDAFDVKGFLPNLYHDKMGFVPLARVPFSRKHAPKDFPYEIMGEPDVVLMGRVENQPVMDNYKNVRKLIPEFTDFNKAIAHRANRMEQLGSPIQLQRTTTEDGQTTEKRGRINADVFSRSAKSLGRGFESAYADLVAIHEARGGLERVGRGGEAKIVKAEAAAIKKWADSRGLIFDSADFDTDWKEQGGKGGREHEVLFNKSRDTVEKRTQAPMHDTWLEYFERLILHNEIFPEAPYEFLGFMDAKRNQTGAAGKGKLWAYVSQKAVTMKRVSDEESIVIDSAKRGLIPMDISEHYDPKTNAVITDTSGGNVTSYGFDSNGDEVIGFIDPIIRLRRQDQNLRPEKYIADILRGKGIEVVRMPDSMLTGPQLQGGPKNTKEGASNAASRTSKTKESERRKRWRDRGKRDKKGKKKVMGAPDRANVATDQDTRNAYDVSQEIYNENFIQQEWGNWEAEADSIMMESSVADIELEIFKAAEGFGNAGSAGFQIAAKRIVANRLQSAMASGNDAKIDYALSLAQAEQEMRGEIGRAMAAMRDPFQTPAQRAAYALGTIIHAAPPGQVTALKKIHGAKNSGVVPKENRAAYDEDLRKLQKRRLADSTKVLKGKGIDIKEIFNSQNEGIGIGTKIDNDALSKLSEKQREVIRMMREGADAEAITNATGVSAAGQEKAMIKFRAALKARLQKLVAKGYNLENISSLINGQAPPEGATPGTEADVTAIMEQTFSARLKPKAGFNINDPRHVMAAAQTLGEVDLDYITRTVGTWYANVFSLKTVAINTLSIPFAGYRMVAERGAEALINTIANNPDSKSFAEFKYIKDGMKQFAKMALYQSYIAFDTEHAMFHTFSKGGGDTISSLAGESHEDVRGYQMGHLLDYVDKAFSKAGFNPKRPSFGRRLSGEKGAKRQISAGSAARGILRLNMGIDEFMRFMVAGGEVGAIAYRLGKSKGLEGAELKKFVTQEMTVSGSSSWEMASEEADISVFTKDLPSKGKGLIKSPTGALAYIMNGLDKTLKDAEKDLQAEKVVHQEVSSGASKLTNLARIDAMRGSIALARITLMPFTRVLMNLVQEGFKRVPNPFTLLTSGAHVGMYLAKNKGKSDPEIAGHISKLGSQFLSTTIALFLLSLIEGDEDDDDKEVVITGSMPSFGKGAQEAKKAAYLEGMGPYKIRFGKGKGSTIIDYSKIDPISITLGTTVDWVREVKKVYGGRKDLMAAGGTLLADTVVGQMTNKTMLRGMNDTFMMAGGRFDPKKWAARQFVTMVMPNIIRQPLRDSNEFFDAKVDSGGAEGLLETMAYEMWPASDPKLGGIIPANPYAPPKAKDAYGTPSKRPDSPFFPITWVLRPSADGYQPNKFNSMVKLARKLDPGNEAIKMPGGLSDTYTHTTASGGKQSHKVNRAQKVILDRAFRSVWSMESLSVTNAEELTKAMRRASGEAWKVAKENPIFQLEAKRKEVQKRK